jgi:hypothetical protein
MFYGLRVPIACRKLAALAIAAPLVPDWANRKTGETDMAKGLRFMAFVSRSDAWAKAANTPWTDRMCPKFRDMLVLRLNRFGSTRSTGKD